MTISYRDSQLTVSVHIILLDDVWRDSGDN